MTTIRLPTEFSELLKSLNDHEVRYLVVGGYAVAYHGYPRSTGDIDIWIAVSEENAERTSQALKDFGFDVPGLSPELFADENKIVRMGYPPLRAEVITSASGVEFESCYERREENKLGGVGTSIIGLKDLKKNKRASGRHKDLDDLENLS